MRSLREARALQRRSRLRLVKFVGGCRRLLQVVRHTVTHEIHAVAVATEAVTVPQEEA